MRSNRTKRAFKQDVYGGMADVLAAFANPRRLEILDLLIQRPMGVDALSEELGWPLATTSQHLQVLRRAGLVERRAAGVRRIYRPAPGVPEVVVRLRRLALARRPELAGLVARTFAELGAPDTIDLPELRRRIAAGRVVLLDVRPPEEYRAGHLPGARSLPLASLADHLDELLGAELVVATCRGPFCTFAAEAVRLLRRHGIPAVRYEGGVADWAVDAAADGVTA